MGLLAGSWQLLSRLRVASFIFTPGAHPQSVRTSLQSSAALHVAAATRQLCSSAAAAPAPLPICSRAGGWGWGPWGTNAKMPRCFKSFNCNSNSPMMCSSKSHCNFTARNFILEAWKLQFASGSRPCSARSASMAWSSLIPAQRRPVNLEFGSGVGVGLTKQ